MDEHTVAEAARGAGYPGRVSYVPVTGSTNSDLIAMAEDGAPEWTGLVAGHQTGGRGRLGRVWTSTPGSSLLVSVLLRPTVPPERTPLLSLGAAVAMAQACRTAAGVELRCKWPNDLVVRERKVGGILPEASVEGGTVRYVVIGTGLNVAQSEEDFPADIADAATSLAIAGGHPDPVAVLGAYLEGLVASFDPGTGLAPGMLDRYRSMCATLGREVRAHTTAGGDVVGRAVAIGETGELVVSTEAGERAVGFGEVEHLGAGPRMQSPPWPS